MSRNIKLLLDELRWYADAPNEADYNGEYDPPLEWEQGEVKELLKYIDTLENKVENLTADKEHLEEELKDLKQDLEDNYRPIPISEQVGISDRDFI